MTPLFLDTSVVLDALGAVGPLRDASRHVMDHAQSGRVRLHLAAESVQEVLFHRMRRVDRPLALEQTEVIRALCVVHRLDDVVIDRAMDLVASTRARGREAFIAATALEAGFDTVVTTDERFVAVPGLRPLHPRDVAT
ncbi:nucleotide-binding protein [Knoellia sinensis KCTC 19936]|uniref:Ribonuclease VapC n=1 Tax=Knoellia sinensis KCTC 19936 TaxID=1385520 RepID=A0A0A0JA98_9MICO|nr:type II toxin-antitoxin system VapC family toxin [Knoellia sinensis]KGN33734.1 nucleotide-binding protein [Knoellia sinensis KCTC 19936]